jgi:cytochrome c oxidase subunit I+III
VTIIASTAPRPRRKRQDSGDILHEVWQPPPGIIGYLSAVNHRTVGVRYIVTGFIFFILAGIAGLLMRIQLAVPGNDFLNADLYNQLFTMHGTTMMFLFAVPIMEGVAIYLVPLMIGARDMAFPRLNAFGYYVYLYAGVVLWFSLFVNSAPDGGWFAYVPLSGPEFSPGLGIDFYVTMITFLEVAALVAAVELIITILKMRAPGMTANRIPLFVWAILVMSFMIVFAMPVLMVGSVELMLDRTIGTHFFNPLQGGDPLLWQHLFWFFGHPEVYIILVPALGIVSAIVPTFCRRPIIGYTPLVLTFIAIGFVSFGLWVHHMFAVGLPLIGMNFFTVASIMIAIPSGVQIFATLATMWHGRIILNTAMLFVIGFVIIFTLGGITGVMVALIPFDRQVHDTYFIVAHFHYVLIGGMVFPLFAGFYYWFPKISGRFLNERWGKWQFWLMFIGFNITFFTMHFTGFLGMPRRVHLFLPGLGWDELNLISTIGAFILGLSTLLFIINAAISLRSGEQAPDNPWGAGTLEWATSSPPAPYNFRETPTVQSREPLWYGQAPNPADHEQQREPGSHQDRFGVQDHQRESIGTSILDAVPEMRIVLPGPTIIPLLAATVVAFTFLMMMFELALVPVGALAFFVMVVVWNWPSKEERRIEHPATSSPPELLSTSTVAASRGSYPPIWWGMLLLILIESVVFGSLISTYLYLRSGTPEWPLGGISKPDLLLPAINALILFASTIPIYLADHGIRKGNVFRLKVGIIVAAVMGATFLTLKVVEYTLLVDYNWATNAYGSIIWTITGFHSAHVISVLLKAVVIGYFAFKGYFTAERNMGVQVNGIYWHFVVWVWLFLFATIYLSPYLF